MRISVLLGGGSALAFALAASAAMAGTMAYGGGAPGQCGPGGCGTPGPVGFGPGQISNEDYPTWPQYINSYRIFYQSDRGLTSTSLSDNLNIFGTSIFDVNAPTLT